MDKGLHYGQTRSKNGPSGVGMGVNMSLVSAAEVRSDAQDVLEISGDSEIPTAGAEGGI